jgi:NitT/TauT family transport system ATP-binding protein
MSSPHSNTTRSAITAIDVSLVFDEQHAALERVDLNVGQGEFVSIVGPSGCGKSSLLRLVAGLETPTGGNLQVDATQQPSSAGFVFQQPTLLPWRTAAANIGLPLELQQQPASKIEQAVDQARQLVGLTSTDMSKLPRMLSGGMQMRVSIARALVTDPKIMLLDEPFAALDDLLRGQLNEELVRLWQQQAWTTLFVTHNVGEAVLLSQRVLVMSPAPGRIAADIAVPLPYPRDVSLRGTAEYAAVVGTVSQALRASAQTEPSR